MTKLGRQRLINKARKYQIRYKDIAECHGCTVTNISHWYSGRAKSKPIEDTIKQMILEKESGICHVDKVS